MLYFEINCSRLTRIVFVLCSFHCLLPVRMFLLALLADAGWPSTPCSKQGRITYPVFSWPLRLLMMTLDSERGRYLRCWKRVLWWPTRPMISVSWVSTQSIKRQMISSWPGFGHMHSVPRLVSFCNGKLSGCRAKRWLKGAAENATRHHQCPRSRPARGCGRKTVHPRFVGREYW